MSAAFTGRYRYRFKKTFFSGELVILQVEITCTDYDPLKQRNETYVFWRDAVSRDMTNTVVNWTEYVPTRLTK